MDKMRNSNFELLRLLAMIVIIASHFLVHGTGVTSTPPLLTNVIIIGSRISNNIFFLLTGYFLQNSKFTFKKLLSLFIQIIFVNYSLLLINLFVFKERNIVLILKQLFPISSSMNWFITAYLGIYMIMPFLQKASTALRKNKDIYGVFIFVLFCIMGLYGFITPSNPYYSGILFGIYIVFVGDFIRYKQSVLNSTHILVYGIGAFILLILIHKVLLKLTIYIPTLSAYIEHFEGNSSPLITLIAISLVLNFKRLKINSKIINLFASSTLFVYLIHDNGAFKDHLWFDILKVQNHLEDLIQYMLICTILIYLSCTCIYLFYKLTIGKFFDFILSKPAQIIDRKIISIFTKE